MFCASDMRFREQWVFDSAGRIGSIRVRGVSGSFASYVIRPDGARSEPDFSAGHAADLHIPNVSDRLRDSIPLSPSRDGTRDEHAAAKSL